MQGGNFSKKKILRFWKSLKYVKEWPEDGGLSKFWHNPFITPLYFSNDLTWLLVPELVTSLLPVPFPAPFPDPFPDIMRGASENEIVQLVRGSDMALLI